MTFIFFPETKLFSFNQSPPTWSSFMKMGAEASSVLWYLCTCTSGRHSSHKSIKLGKMSGSIIIWYLLSVGRDPVLSGFADCTRQEACPRRKSQGNIALKGWRIVAVVSVTLMILMTIRREGWECEWGAIQLLQYPWADCCLGPKDPAVLCLSVQAGGLVGGRPRKGNMYNSS